MNRRNVLLSAAYLTLAYLGPPVGGYTLDTTLGLSSPVPSSWRVLGWLPLVGGFLLWGGSGRALIQIGKGTPNPRNPPREIVVAGPFKWVRNPMYIGLFLLQTGAGWVLGLVSIYSLLVLSFAYHHLYIVRIEEPELERRFGESYRKYKAEVGRWLPGLRP